MPGRCYVSALSAALLLVAPLALAACSAAGGQRAPASSRRGEGAERTKARRPGAFGVGYGLVTWTDPHGATENFYTGVTSPGRVLRVETALPEHRHEARVGADAGGARVRFRPLPGSRVRPRL